LNVNASQQLDAFLQKKLAERKADGLYRELICPGNTIDFSSNDYLGFSQLPELFFSEKNLSEKLKAGATGSRLISGNSALAEETESMIASFHHADAALIFNSGYQANIGLLSCLASKDDTIISDELSHASIIDGIRLSHAKRFKFRHNDVADLEQKLQQAVGKRFVVVESIYSMDGDEAPLQELSVLCEKYDAILIVDEAHAAGVYGHNGEGLVCQYHLEEKVYARIVTFGKALGIHGAAVAGSNALRQHLINHARSFIYTTALPPHVYLQLQQAYHLLPGANRKKLFELIKYYKKATSSLNGISFIESNSPVQGIMVGDNHNAKALSAHLFEKGFFVKAILSPTVPAGKERLRICLHLFNTTTQIDELLDLVKTYLTQIIIRNNAPVQL
jgi:8-amino-7-oxononanoate synthase